MITNEILEKEYQKTRYKNLFVRHLTGYNRHCPENSIGFVSHWMYVFSNLNIAETIKISENYIQIWGDKINYENKNGVVFFDFPDNDKWGLYKDNQDCYFSCKDNEEAKEWTSEYAQWINV